MKKPPLLIIDRSFRIETVGDQFPVWLGRVGGEGMSGKPDQDPRSVLIQIFDASKAVTITGLTGKRISISGEERRLKIRRGKIIPIDFHTGWALLKEKGQRNLRWMHHKGIIGYSFETDTVLRTDDEGGRTSLALYFFEKDDRWVEAYQWLSEDRFESKPVLGLTQIN